MLRRLDLRSLGDNLRGQLPRAEVADQQPIDEVREIIAAVRANGDEALRELTARYDGADVAELRVPPGEVASAVERLPAKVVEAIRTAERAIADFHHQEMNVGRRYERDGIVVEARLQPVDRAGLYVPGGLAAYPSTVLMTACPAWAAGVPEIAMCLPPAADFTI